MACSHLETIRLSPPSPSQSVFREECTLCFDTIDDETGVDVCLQCFNGSCPTHSEFHLTHLEHPLAVNIRRTRKVVERDEPPMKMSKLAIAAETDDDRYEYTIVPRCLQCKVDLDKKDDRLSHVIEAVMTANTFSRKEEVKAWELELSGCEHLLLLKQSEPQPLSAEVLGHCSACELQENLWICLECGKVSCGRSQLGGIPGNSHAVRHATDSGHAAAVKLGSLSPDTTADVYCYKCDDSRMDESLEQHLASWGIDLSAAKKTEKSLTELQIEQNMNWEFQTTSSDGKELRTVFGPGLTGIRNLGNSCYIAAVLQCLFDLPEFQSRYFLPDDSPVKSSQPATDLEVQLRKVAHGLLSGKYSKPDPHLAETSPHQRGLSPAMLKYLVGRGHHEFSTMRQQDAFEFLQHILSLVQRANTNSPTADPTKPLQFTVEQRLQCLDCKKVRYSTVEQESIFIDIPKEKFSPDTSEYRPVTMAECLDKFTSPETVEMICSGCKGKSGFTKTTKFKTLPAVLVINASKMILEGWQPVKVDVPVIVPEEPFLMDEYLSKGKQDDEEELPEDVAESDKEFVPLASGLSDLQQMGFSYEKSVRALHATGNTDTQAAMEWLFSHMEDASLDLPVDLKELGGKSKKSSATTTVDPQSLEMLVAMGFSEALGRRALQETKGDMEQATAWIFSRADGDAMDNVAEETPSVVEAKDAVDETSESKEEKPLPGSSSTPASYQLQSIICHKGRSIHAGHYVAFIRKEVDEEGEAGGGEAGETKQKKLAWVMFNDEKVVEVADAQDMTKFAYVYFFKRVESP